MMWYWILGCIVGWFIVGLVSGICGVLVDRYLVIYNKVPIRKHKCLELNNALFCIIIGGVTFYILCKAIWFSLRDRRNLKKGVGNE
jgi:hypothetical protein